MRRRSAVITAVGLFTVIPTPPTEIDRDAGARAMRVFPLVGLLLGAVGALIVAVLAWVSAPALFTAVAVVAAWAALTGGLHLDGIADTADGLGSRKPPEQALAIMRQSDIGPMGVIAVVFVLLAAVSVLVGPVTPVAWIVLVAPMVGRTCCVLACGRWRPGARSGGFGALFVGSITRSVAIAWIVGCLALCSAAGLAVDLIAATPGRATVSFLLAGALALLVSTAQSNRFVHRLGGLTGDTFGALIETGTLAFCVSVTLLLGLPIT